MAHAALKVRGEALRPVTMRERPALERLVESLTKQEKEPFSADEFNRFERELGERVREVAREALSRELAKADVDVDCVLIDGVEHRRVLRGTETYMTTMGPVKVERTLYKDRTDPDADAVAVLEQRLGIIGGFWMPEAAKQAAWVVSQMTPALSAELFSRVGTMRPSKSSLDRLPKEVDTRWEDDREAFERELREVTEIPEETKSIAVSLDGVLALADVVSLHVPLTDATRNMIGAKQLAAMKPGAILINAARGGVVDEAALADALKDGQLGGAALDVFETEPLSAEAGAKFAGIANLILTPHIAGVTEESNVRVSELIADVVLAHLEKA